MIVEYFDGGREAAGGRLCFAETRGEAARRPPARGRHVSGVGAEGPVRGTAGPQKLIGEVLVRKEGFIHSSRFSVNGQCLYSGGD